ncbi:ABC transporter permease [Paracoccus sp. Z330]|uniref:ABC transporter permease n=1 Tax=Paracoccus onchidii TaxID=3017813 RepID=A0ABT4ZGG5_9RHOB|nr:ABC transporter permease [Paracoccus onchidii]MDB6178415.1 ABC transporter permease [Paracoccus onchidii]
MEQQMKAGTPAGAGTQQKPTLTARAGPIAQRYGILIALVVLCLVLAIVSDNFLSSRNIINVLRQTSINGILAIGMTFVILTRGIDLSVGSVVALSGVVAASFATTSSAGFIPGAPYIAVVPLVIGVLTGMAAGAVSGAAVARFAVPAFVATLGMLSAARGMTLIYTDGRPIPALSDGFRWIGTGDIAGIPLPIILFGLVFAVSHFVLTRTRFGRHVYAVGGNPHATKVSGISVNRIRFAVYVISGALAGIAGMILAARTGSALPQAGVAYELDAIAAVVIGGTSLAGGVGRVSGTVIGALLIGVLNNGLDLLGVESYYQQVIKGALIVAAVMLDRSRKAEV